MSLRCAAQLLLRSCRSCCQQPPWQLQLQLLAAERRALAARTSTSWMEEPPPNRAKAWNTPANASSRSSAAVALVVALPAALAAPPVSPKPGGAASSSRPGDRVPPLPPLAPADASVNALPRLPSRLCWLSPPARGLRVLPARCGLPFAVPGVAMLPHYDARRAAKGVKLNVTMWILSVPCAHCGSVVPTGAMIVCRPAAVDAGKTAAERLTAAPAPLPQPLQALFTLFYSTTRGPVLHVESQVPASSETVRCSSGCHAFKGCLVQFPRQKSPFCWSRHLLITSLP